MSKLESILEEAVKQNENNKREMKNPLTKEMMQYQRVLENSSQISASGLSNSQNTKQEIKKEIKQEYIVIDEDSNEISSQQNNKTQSTQNTQQKTKYIDILRKREQEKSQIQHDLFQGKIFIFFMKTFELGEKRIKIFSDKIVENQGEVYTTIQEYFEKYQTFYDLIQTKNTHIFFICPENAKVDEIRKNLQPFSLNMDAIIDRVVSSEFLVEVLRTKKKLDPDPFCKITLSLPYVQILINMFNYNQDVHRIRQNNTNNNFAQLGASSVINNQKGNSQQGQDIGKSSTQQLMQMVNEDSKSISKDKMSSDDDSIQDNGSVDLECLTNISRHILMQRKMKQDAERQRARKKTRHLWDYNYDSEQEQDQSEEESEGSLSNVISIRSTQDEIGANRVQFTDMSETPLKEEENILLSKVTEKEEISGNKGFLTSVKKLKRGMDVMSQGEFLFTDQKEPASLFKLTKSSFKEDQNLKIQNQYELGVSPQRSPLKQKGVMEYFDLDSGSDKDRNRKHIGYFDDDQEDEEDLSDFDQRFITELPAVKKEHQSQVDEFSGLGKKNNTQLKSLKKNTTPIEIILSSDSENDDKEKAKEIKIVQKEQFKQENEKPKQNSNSLYGNPFKPFSGQLRRERYWDERKDYFVCAAGAPKENYNKLITEELEKLLKIYQQDKDVGRSIAYRKAVGVIKSLDFQITSVKDVQKINGIGEKTKEKIKEILNTGSCQRAQILTNTERNQVIELLSKVWGIGPSTAASLYEKKIKTISDLRQNQHLLNRNQKIGLQYFEDLVEKMPRQEATLIVEELIKGFKELYPEDHDRYELIACGSYRRGKEVCGDVDLLICRKDGEENKPKKLMMDLICRLEQKGVLIEHLQFPKPGSYGTETYMGIGKLKDGKHRRIDLKYYPKDLYGYALLYFTGSDYFNRSMRLFARKKGYSLSDHGLYAVNRIDKQTKVTSSLAIPCYTEEEVFAALNLEYKPPAMRSV